MSEALELAGVIHAVVEALERAALNYYVSGSVASSMRGTWRATNDIDFVVALPEAKVDAFIADLAERFVVDRAQARDAIAAGTSFNLIDRVTYLKVDVFPLVTAFDEMAAARADAVILPGMSGALRVAATEDLILAKLRWYQLGDEQSEVQRRDIAGLVTLNRDTLDLTHLRHWAAPLGVTHLLDQFLGPSHP